MGELEPFPVIGRIDLAYEPEFELGGMTVLPARRAVLMNGARRDLQPRVMQVLIALAKARPQVVSRDKLAELCWEGRIVGDDALNRCIWTLRHLAQEFTPQPFAIETVPRVGHRLVETGAQTERGRQPEIATRRHARTNLIIGGALVAVIGLALFLSQSVRWPRESSADVPKVVVAPTTNDPQSRALARDLAVNVGGLAGQTEPRLVTDSSQPLAEGDLILGVGYQPRDTALDGQAYLRMGPNGPMLWNKDFHEPTSNVGNLRQQIAHTAAYVLRCALDGMASEEPLGGEILKRYLNICADELNFDSRDYRPVVQELENVVRSVPGFAGGWSKLLNAEMYAVQDFLYPDDTATIPSLKRHIAAARKIDPALPEAYLAEYILIPPANFVERGRLLDAAVRRNPNHANTRSFRALFFVSVGRMDDAVREAREAAKLDPLSPELRDGYVGALANAGHFDAALAEVAKAERLWPSASSVVMARYRVFLRYGDARQALRLIHSTAVDSPAIVFQRAFIEARLERSPQAIERAIRQSRSAFQDAPEAFDPYAQALAEFDRKDELLSVMLTYPRPHLLAWSAEVIFRPAFSEVHRDPRFMRAAHRLGLLRYWRTSGYWPDFCFAADLPYDCQTEAATIAAR